MSSSRWVFLRHGQSEANAARRLAGWWDTPLTELGRQQAVEAGRVLAGESFARLVSSDLVRARDTALLAMESWSLTTGQPPPELGQLPGLRERNLAEAQGMTMDEARASGVMARLVSWDERPGGGESNRMLGARVLQALVELSDAPGSTLVVAHGGVIRVILGLVDGEDPLEIGRQRVENCVPLAREISAGTWERLAEQLAG